MPTSRPVPRRTCTTHAPGRGRPPRPCLGAAAPARSRSCSTARSSWRVAVTVTTTVSVVRRARPSCTSLPACRCRRCRPSRARLRRLPEPDAGPDAAPAGGRSRSAERSELDRHGRQQELRARDAVRGRGCEDGLRLVGSATPNVVPAGATVKVTFLFPADEDGWIYVNPRPGEGGGLVNADQIGIPGKILITSGGRRGLVEPVAGKPRAEAG